LREREVTPLFHAVNIACTLQDDGGA